MASRCRLCAYHVLAAAVLLLGDGEAVLAQRTVVKRQLPPSVAAAVDRSEARVITSRAATVVPASDSTAPRDTAATRRVPATSERITLRAGEFITAPVIGRATLVRKPRPASPAGSVSVDSFYALPERIVGVATDQDLAFLRPAFLPEGDLRYVPASGLFRGGFSIGLEDSVHSRERRELSGAFHFQFGGDADSVAPRGLDISHTNLPLEGVQILVRDPADSVRVRIVTAADVRGTEVWLRARPALSFGVVRERAQGLGLQRIPITVSVLGTRRAAPLAVKLTTDRGSLEPDTLLVGSGMITTVSWRTEGLGPATILAHAVGADDARATVGFVFPVFFLIAALVGGAAGAALKFMGAASSGRTFLASMGIGMLAGVVAAVLYYAIGVSILKVDVKVPFFNEAAVFSLAALAGLFGVKLAGS